MDNIFQFQKEVVLYHLPISKIEEGIHDGSIQVTNPRELAEAIMTLTNIWLNPLVSMPDENSMRNRCLTFNHLLHGAGIDRLLTDEMIESYIGYCKAH